MMCYRDKTFCPFRECAKFSSCPDALTDAIIKDANRWWGVENAPIAQLAVKPDCYKEPVK
jgi:hypothetical protein